MIPAAARAAADALAAALPAGAGPGALVDAWDARLAKDAARRRRSGGYATPPALAAALLDRALDPLVARALRAPDPAAALLGLRVLDPACGAGRLLAGAADRIARALAGARDGDLARARREVVDACVAGVDRDPVAAALAGHALGLLAPGSEPRVLNGDALLGATPAAVAAGVPDGAFAGRGALGRRNRRERAEGLPGPGPGARAAADAWCAAFLDPAAGVTTALVRDLAAHPAAVPAAVRRRVAALARGRRLLHWHLAFPGELLPAPGAPGPGWRGGFDLVVTNPPFLTRMERRTAPDPGAAALLRARMAAGTAAYADSAALFLVLGMQLARPGGAVAMVLPQAVLGARDAGPARRAALADGALEWLWVAPGRLFAASVQVCAVVLRRGGPRRAAVARAAGAAFTPLPPVRADMDALARAGTLSPLAADALGAPPAVPLAVDGRLGDLCRPTAGFRQHHYGLAGAVGDGPGGHPLVTVGMVDPARCWWGQAPARFAGRAWRAPAVDLDLVEDEAVRRWARAALVPKVVLATQTRVLEAAVDEAGAWVPATPLISIAAEVADLWRVAAVLAAPPVSAWALRRHGGAALGRDAIRLRARDVAALPCPADRAQWTASALALREAARAPTAAAWREALERAARHGCAAYRVAEPDGLMAWWRDRLPPWRGAAA